MTRFSQRTLGVTAAASVIAALAVIVTLTVVVAGPGHSSFDTHGSVGLLTKALRSKGLALCSSTGPDSGTGEGGSISIQTLRLALPAGCADSIELRVDAYQDADHRDAAARNAEAQERARHYGVVYTWHQYTLYLQSDDASGPTNVRDRIVAALDSVGAR